MPHTLSILYQVFLGICLNSESQASVTEAEHRITQTDSNAFVLKLYIALSKDLAAPLGRYPKNWEQELRYVHSCLLQLYSPDLKVKKQAKFLYRKRNKQYIVLCTMQNIYYVHSYISNRSKRMKWAVEMAPWLRACIALAEDLR